MFFALNIPTSDFYIKDIHLCISPCQILQNDKTITLISLLITQG